MRLFHISFFKVKRWQAVALSFVLAGGVIGASLYGGRDLLLHHVLMSYLKPYGINLRIKNIAFHFPLGLTLRDVTVEKSTQHVASFDHLRMDFSWKALIWGSWMPQSVDIHRLYFERQKGGETAPISDTTIFDGIRQCGALLGALPQCSIHEIWEGPPQKGILWGRHWQGMRSDDRATDQLQWTMKGELCGPQWAHHVLSFRLGGTSTHPVLDAETEIREGTWGEVWFDFLNFKVHVEAPPQGIHGTRDDWSYRAVLDTSLGNIQGHGLISEKAWSATITARVKDGAALPWSWARCLGSLDVEGHMVCLQPFSASPTLQGDWTLKNIEAQTWWALWFQKSVWSLSLTSCVDQPQGSLSIQAPWGHIQTVLTRQKKTFRVQSDLQLYNLPKVQQSWPWSTGTWHLDLSGDAQGDTIKGDLTGHLQGDSVPTMTGSIQARLLAKDQLCIDQAQWVCGKDEMNLSGRYVLQTQEYWGDMHAKVKRIQAYLRPFGIPYWGGGDLKVILPQKPSVSHPARATWVGKNILAEGVYIEKITAETTWFHEKNQWVCGWISTEARHVTTQDMILDTLSGQWGEKNPSAMGPWRLSCQGLLWEHAFNVSTQGIYHRQAQKVECHRGQGDLLGFPWAFQKPFSLSVQRSTWTLSPFLLRVLGGEIRTTPWIWNDQKLNGTVSAEHLALKPLQSMKPYLPLSGQVFATCQISGERAAPQMTLKGQIEHLRFKGQDKNAMQGLVIKADGTLQHHILKGVVSFTGHDVVKGECQGTVPYHLDLKSFSHYWLKENPVSVTWRGTGDLQILTPWLSNRGIDLRGIFQTQGRIQGSLKNPLVQGTCHIQDGVFDDDASGLALQDVTGAIEYRKDHLQIQSFSATDGDKGTLKIQGSWFWNNPASTRFEIMMKTLNFLDLQEFSLKNSGSLMLTRNKDVWKLSGRLRADEAQFDLNHQISQTIMIPHTVEHIAHKKPLGLRKMTQSTQPSCMMDVHIDVPKTLVVRGQGLDCTLEGMVALAGHDQAPRLLGELSLIRGTFDFLGRHLTLDHGKLRFDGARENEPYIALSTLVFEGGVTIKLSFTGRLHDAVLAVTSVPALPIDDLWSRLLFHKPLAEISIAQTLQLANTAAQLQGKWSMTHVMDQFRQSLGLDLLDFDFATKDQDKVSSYVRLGKRLNHWLTVGYDQGVDAAAPSKVVVELRLTPQLTLESNTAGEIGASWRRNY